MSKRAQEIVRLQFISKNPLPLSKTQLNQCKEDGCKGSRQNGSSRCAKHVAPQNK